MQALINTALGTMQQDSSESVVGNEPVQPQVDAAVQTTKDKSETKHTKKVIIAVCVALIVLLGAISNIIGLTQSASDAKTEQQLITIIIKALASTITTTTTAPH